MKESNPKPLIRTVLLLLIVVFAAVIRFLDLGENPSILNRDEAALGYNAYLLTETGKDEWGRQWPFVLESFGDYKLPGYPLTLVALFSFLPVEDWVVRLPSALAGIGLIPLSYLFAKKLQFKRSYSVLFAFLTATTPVLIFYSRLAFEANVALTFFVLGLVLLLKKTTSNATDLTAALCFAIAVMTYNSPLLLLPFVAVGLVFYRGWKQPKKWLLAGGLIFGIFVITTALLMPITAQKQGITIFQDETLWAEWSTYRNQLSPMTRTFIGSRPVYWLTTFIENASQALAPSFLVERGGTHPWHTLPGWGHIFSLQYVLFLLGLLGTTLTLLQVELRRLRLRVSGILTPPERSLNSIFFPAEDWKSHSKSYVMLLYLLIISLVPASITVDAPHATRSLFFFFLINLFVIIGIKIFIYWLQRILGTRAVAKYRFLFLPVFALLLVSPLIQYGKQYAIWYPHNLPQSLTPGYQTLLQDVEQKYPQANVAVVDPDGYHYILTAWYLKMSPTTFFETVVRQQPNQIGFRYGEQVGRYHFIAMPSDRVESETILLEWRGTTWNISSFE